MNKSQKDLFMIQWKRDDEMFVETRASKQIFDCLKQNSLVTVTGSSGIGKTFTVRHIALKMAAIGFKIVNVTNIDDFYQEPFNVRTLFVLDDFFGKYALDGVHVNYWLSKWEGFKALQLNSSRTIVVCRIEIYKDKLFNAIPGLSSCICNFKDPNLCLNMEENRCIAESYLTVDAFQFIQYADLNDCFPLLCKISNEQSKLNFVDFFQNPFAVYEEIITKLSKYEYCALALCVMFNNHLNEEWLIGETDEDVQTVIEQVLEACSLSKNTSKIILKSAFESLDVLISRDLTKTTDSLRHKEPVQKWGHLKSLKNFFISYRTRNRYTNNRFYCVIHDLIFDCFAHYVGKVMIECLINNADSKFISERFLYAEQDSNRPFSIVVPEQFLQMYMGRVISDWLNGEICNVFFNINMKRKQFRRMLLKKVNSMDPSTQQLLAYKVKYFFTNTEEQYYSFSSTLFICCFLGYVEIVQWYCKQNLPVNCYNNRGETPLYVACKQGHFEIVQTLVDHNALVDFFTIPEKNPLCAACENGNIEIVKLLLDHKADFNFGTMALFVACENGKEEVLKLLLDHKADVNFITKNRETPLIAACKKANVEIVKLLLDHNADANVCTVLNDTPLLVACKIQNLEMVTLLLDKKADVNDVIPGKSPLMIACEENNIELAKLLLSHKADINFRTRYNTTSLSVACQNENVEMVKILLDHKADFRNFETSLLIAFEKGHTEILEVFNRCIANFNLSRASEKCSVEKMKFLSKNTVKFKKHIFPLDNKPDFNFGAMTGIATKMKKLLPDQKVDSDNSRVGGKALMFKACEKGYVEIVKLLLSQNVDVNVRKTHEEISLLLSRKSGNTEIVKSLLDKYANINFSTKDSITPLLVACEKENAELVKLLLDHNADINVGTKDGITPLLVACEKENAELVKLLLDHNADINVGTKDGITPLLVACEKENAELVKLLLDHNADINVGTKDGITPLLVACEKANAELVKLLLDHNANINVGTKDGITPLLVSCEKENVELVKFLIAHKADVNFSPIVSNTPLFFSCRKGHTKIVKLLLDNKAEVNTGDISKGQNKTPLLVACEEGNTEIVHLLLNHKADVNIGTEDDGTPLLVACKKGHTEIVKLLLDYKANVNVGRYINKIPLFVACTEGNTEIVKLLLDHKAKADIDTVIHITSLLVCQDKGNTDIIRLLLENLAECEDRSMARNVLINGSNFEKDIISTYKAAHQSDMTSYHFLLLCDGIQIDCIIGKTLARKYSELDIPDQENTDKNTLFKEVSAYEFAMMYKLYKKNDIDFEKDLFKSLSRGWWMLGRWILANNNVNITVLEKALCASFSTGDSKYAKAISWRITREFYSEFKSVIKYAIDIYPGVKCTCLHSENRNHVFCSHQKIITVISESPVHSLPKEYSGFKIEVFNPNESRKTKCLKQELENYMKTEFKESFQLKCDVPATTAEDMFRKHSNLTLICPSVVKLRDLKNNREIEKEICIQLYCKRKGVIPIDEKHFPDTLLGIPVDVMEGQVELMTNLNIGDKIETMSCSGTLAGFVRHMKVYHCFLTCAHVMIDLNTLLSNDFRGEQGGEAFLRTPTGVRFQCGNMIWRAFDHDDPHKTSVDAALVLMQAYSTVDPNSCVQISGQSHPCQSLHLSSPFLNLNSNCVDHEELCCSSKTERAYYYGAETGRDHCSDITFPRQADTDVHFSDIGMNAASINGHIVQPLWLHQPAHVQITGGSVGDKRIFRMYNQMGLNLSLKRGDSGTGIYIVNNPNGKNGCVGMAIAFCSSTGLCVVTPLKDILKRIYS